MVKLGQCDWTLPGFRRCGRNATRRKRRWWEYCERHYELSVEMYGR